MSHDHSSAQKAHKQDAKTLAARAQQKASDAATATVGAVKEHPVAAAAIAGGVAAAVAGTVVGVKKLRDKDDAEG